MRKLLFALTLLVVMVTMSSAEIVWGEVRNAKVKWVEQTHNGFIMFQADCGADGLRYFYFSEVKKTFSAILLSAVTTGNTVTFWANSTTTLVYSFNNVNYDAYVVTRMRINTF